MAIQKHQIPILEYDDDQKAVIMPGRERLYEFPPYAVFPFLMDEVEQFARQNNCRQIGEFVSATKTYPIYSIHYNGKDVCFCQAPVGAAPAVQILDYLISYGVKSVISAGTCGTLVEQPENEFLVPVEALRCEGTSYHYLPPSRTVSIHHEAIAAIEKSLHNNKIPYHKCKTWSTDGFFRETKEIVNYRREEGFEVVEMECSALAACAQFRNIRFGQILFTADTLANVDAHDDRDWGLASFKTALKLCFDAVTQIQE